MNIHPTRLAVAASLLIVTLTGCTGGGSAPVLHIRPSTTRVGGLSSLHYGVAAQPWTYEMRGGPAYLTLRWNVTAPNGRTITIAGHGGPVGGPGSATQPAGPRRGTFVAGHRWPEFINDGERVWFSIELDGDTNVWYLTQPHGEPFVELCNEYELHIGETILLSETLVLPYDPAPAPGADEKTWEIPRAFDRGPVVCTGVEEPRPWRYHLVATLTARPPRLLIRDGLQIVEEPPSRDDAGR